MAASGVRVLSVTHVRPAETEASNVVDDDHTIKLSLFDSLSIPIRPIELLFFYDGDGDGDDLPPFPALLSTLRSSLAATLAVFTPLAGHIAVSKSSGDVVIDCSPGVVSQGVRFVEAEYAGSTDEIRRLAIAAEHDAEACAQLVPALAVGPLPVPALAVQVTRPAADTAAGGGGGIGAVVVGVSISHVVADGAAASGFIQAWAAAARGGRGCSLTELGFQPPVFDRTALINAHPEAEAVARKVLRILVPALPMVNEISGRGTSTTQLGQKTYLLSANQILALKQRISLQLQSKHGKTVAKPPSTYAAVVSLIWTSGVRAKNALSHAEDDAYLVFTADCRARLHPPMPAAFFGNCATQCYARAMVSELRDGDGGDGALACAAAAVQEAVREQLKDPLGDFGRWLERFQALPPDRYVHVGSSNWFPAYESDFGWGKPSRVELVSAFNKNFAALIGAPEGAVQVSVTLDREHMEDFEANFMSLLQGSA